MDGAGRAKRLRGLPQLVIDGHEVPVAVTHTARLLGLALLPRDFAGPGLLIPRCRSVHSFGMRFPIDVLFLGHDGSVVASHHAVPPRRIVSCRTAAAALELPAGGEGVSQAPLGRACFPRDGRSPG
jgi:uncharacterized protein